MIKFIVSSQLLAKNLHHVNGILTTNKSVPIVENILFVIENSSLTLIGTDLETTITTKVELSESDGDGSIVIPGKLIVETISSLPDVPVIFTVNDDYSIEVSAGEAFYKLMGFDAEQFPQVKEVEDEQTFKMPVDVLVNGISRTAFATGNAEIRPVMAGIFCQLSPEGITFVATDAHRLVKYHNNTVKIDKEAALIIPKKPLLQLKNILQNTDETMEVSFSESRIRFTLNTITVTTKLIEGKYPNYEAVIPKNNTNVLQVERQNLLQKIRNITLYANQSTYQVRLKIEDTKLTLTAEDIDYSTKATVNLPCVFEGEESEFEIGFSSKFLQEILSNLMTKDVVFKFSHPTGAGLVFEMKDQPDEEDVLMLIMPLMLNN
ncbi:MAG: DNA polymerase III subunit beta [Bacteroidales bacterium]|nr:DNA polymerase III subunit beta [Bacteroidales bacterium]